jgi:hypothetical protein
METLIVYTVLIFERTSMKLLVLKNLSAHRKSNKMTTIIYSLTLGCIIFIVVASQVQLDILSTGNLGEINYSIIADYNYDGNDYRRMYAADIDPVIMEYQDYIDSWGYTTVQYGKATYFKHNAYAATTAEPQSYEWIFMYGISPS